MINRIKKNKYFTILLDCTLDNSYREQLTLILRVVEVLDNIKFKIYEYYIRFIHIFLLIKFSLDLKDCRSQVYNNKANKKE